LVEVCGLPLGAGAGAPGLGGVAAEAARLATIERAAAAPKARATGRRGINTLLAWVMGPSLVIQER
jgi:hypothetical protein